MVAFLTGIFKPIFFNGKFLIIIKISLTIVSKGLIDNNSALIQIMALRLFGDKPLSEAMLTRFTDTYMRH